MASTTTGPHVLRDAGRSAAAAVRARIVSPPSEPTSTMARCGGAARRCLTDQTSTERQRICERNVRCVLSALTKLPAGQWLTFRSNRAVLVAVAGAAASAAAAVVARPAAGADPVVDLMDRLPPGYSESSCHSVDGPMADPGAIAMVECSGNSLPGGPTSARYTLLRDTSALENLHEHVPLTPLQARPRPWIGRHAGLLDSTGRPARWLDRLRHR